MTYEFKPVPNIPKTYEQFVLEDQQLTPEQGQSLYSDLAEEGIGEAVGYGPICRAGRPWINQVTTRTDRQERNWLQPLNGDCAVGGSNCFYTNDDGQRRWVCTEHNYFSTGHAISSNVPTNNSSSQQVTCCARFRCYNIVSRAGELCYEHSGR